MNSRLLLLALLISAGTAVAQSGQAPSTAAPDPRRTPVSYNPQDAPPASYSHAGELSVAPPTMPSAVDLSARPSMAASPSMPDAVDIPTGPASVSAPVIPPNNYGPSTPSSDGRLTVTPTIGNGAPTPMSNTYPPALSGNAPAPPTCDKVCY